MDTRNYSSYGTLQLGHLGLSSYRLEDLSLQKSAACLGHINSKVRERAPNMGP